MTCEAIFKNKRKYGLRYWPALDVISSLVWPRMAGRAAVYCVCGVTSRRRGAWGNIKRVCAAPRCPQSHCAQRRSALNGKDDRPHKRSGFTRLHAPAGRRVLHARHAHTAHIKHACVCTVDTANGGAATYSV